MFPADQHPLGIDHPLVTVNDHAATVEHYRRMGFAPSPASSHPWGTVTSLVMFPNNFLELIAVDDPGKFGAVDAFCFGRTLGGFLDRRGEGVSLVALHSRDTALDQARLVGRGVPSQGLIDFRRRMTKPDGSPDEAVVSLAMLLDPALPDASNFLCHQHRPELIWVEAWQHHPNGAKGIVAVTYRGEPAALEARWRALYGDTCRWADGVLETDTGCGVLRCVDARTAALELPGVPLPQISAEGPHVVAIRIATASLARARAILLEHGVPHADLADRLLLAPASCGNVILELVEVP